MLLSSSCSYCSVDKVYDLLVDYPKKRGFSRVDRPSLDIKSGNNGMYVPGLTTVSVDGLEDVHNVLNRGQKNRATGATNLNEHSSRSHLVLRIEVHGRNEKSGDTTYGKLHLIDLAGSERVSRSGATDERLREAQYINLSLSMLGNVIECLANRGEGKRRHIPYRDSSLTYLLQDSLGAGDSKTLMFVQVSNSCSDLSETVCSLNFASRVRGADLGAGPAKRHTSQSSASSGGVGPATNTRSRRRKP
jgi:kinesin family member C2/C3